ncbi:redoxin [Solemya pervernicosa gill symbiont]|uniref:Redoxin n=1 Tax=Solemya pervernicosa gill symbiont TaxID=642797 RepID=A0A1T2L344_9GAMM|nr:redoxin [Solemya pervernicosa gill symbiont]
MKRASRFKTVPTTLLLMSLMAAGANAAQLATDTPAPDFTLKSSSGENLKLSEYRGNVVMINFWASWCAPCRQEMPLIDALHQRYEKLGFTVLGINVDSDSSAAIKWLKEQPVSFPILFDSENSVSQGYQVAAMPSTVMVDRDGKIRFTHLGYQPGLEAEYQQQIRTLVAE